MSSSTTGGPAGSPCSHVTITGLLDPVAMSPERLAREVNDLECLAAALKAEGDDDVAEVLLEEARDLRRRAAG